MNKKWHEMTDAELEESLSTSIVNGLTRKSAASKRRKCGSNIVFRLPHGSFSSYLKDVMSDSTSVILIFAVLIASIFENTPTAYFIAGLIVLNCFVAVFTYVKAHRVLEGMGEYTLPGAKVVRDGHLYLVSMNSLVPGDLIYLRAGDIVPADARVIAAEGFYVSEKGVTENNAAVRKSTQGARLDEMKNENMYNMLFAASVVLKGSARAIVVETGENTLVSKKDGTSLSFEHDSLDVFVLLKKYGSKISLLTLGMVIAVMLIEILTGLNTRGLYEIFLTGMSLAVAAMTEFYTAFGYIVVACGLFGARTYKRRSVDSSVILKNITALERIRDVDCVIFKKEGILTQRNKVIEAMYSGGQMYRIKDYDKADEGFAPLVEAAVITTGMYMRSALSSDTVNERIPTPDEQAILDCAKRYGLYNVGLDEKYPLVQHTSEHRAIVCDYTVVRSGKKLRAYVRGAARTVLDKCGEYSIGSMNIPIDATLRRDLLAVIAEYERSNMGVLALAVCDITPEELSAGGLALMHRKNMTLLGYISLKAPMFDNAPETIERLIASGVKLIVNSPIASDEDLAAAKSLGICKDDSEILTESTLENADNETLVSLVDKYSVYMGLKNASLRKMIGALRESGRKVAFCALTLSDISVLESADVGYTHAQLPERMSSQNKVPSLPGTSSDALKFKADVIIPGTGESGEGGILSIEKSLLTSKLIYKNLVNLFSYMTCVQLSRLFIILYSAFSKADLMTPPQILFSGLIVDFLAVLSIAFAKPDADTAADYKRSRREMNDLPKFLLRNALFGVFWAAMTIFIPTVISLTGIRLTGVALVSSVFVSFTVTQLLTLAEVKKKTSIFARPHSLPNPVYALSAVAILLLVIITALTPRIGAVMSVVMPKSGALVSILLTVLFSVGIHEIYKLLSKKN